MKFKILSTLTFILLFTSTLSQASELLSWSEQASENFKGSACVTIPGTPGIPKECTPNVNVPYPCPSWPNVAKMCNHTIKGVCTPAVPGIPSTKPCADVNLGSVSVKTDGGIYADITGISDNQIAVKNTASVSVFGETIAIPMDCTLNAGTKATYCVNMLTGKTTEALPPVDGVCVVDTSGIAALSEPSIKADLCTDMVFELEKSQATGSVVVRVQSSVNFGSISVVGHTVSAGSESWNPVLVSKKIAAPMK